MARVSILLPFSGRRKKSTGTAVTALALARAASRRTQSDVLDDDSIPLSPPPAHIKSAPAGDSAATSRIPSSVPTLAKSSPSTVAPLDKNSPSPFSAHRPSAPGSASGTLEGSGASTARAAAGSGSGSGSGSGAGAGAGVQMSGGSGHTHSSSGTVANGGARGGGGGGGVGGGGGGGGGTTGGGGGGTRTGSWRRSVTSEGITAADFDARDVDYPLEPLDAPPPLHIHVADYVLATGPHSLCKELFGPVAEIPNRVAASERVSNVVCDEWGPDPEDRALAIRKMTYTVPTPIGPTGVSSVQRLIAKEDGGFVLENRVVPHVKGIGPCMAVIVQVVGLHLGPGRTRLVASLRTEWFKHGLFINRLKFIVDANAPKDSRRYYKLIQKELAAKYGVVSTAPLPPLPRLSSLRRGSVAPGGRTPRAGSEAEGLGTPRPSVAVPHGTSAGSVTCASAVTVHVAVPPYITALVALLVVALVVSILALVGVSSQLGRSSRALEAVAAALAARQGQCAGS
ncbi:hypothetical protein HYH03_010379 [Edaphochlamys debaryana]|uniref:VASt domain-containing protein n=1 Tax=Edaphochlamys debaryana TaxID=47281 RepID=A0A835XZ99_9CHLO|nr:hypothetical protein HYH03_010379 [Edaphochlamys debaryana]|eukprot:KAG2491166.1 hypothetical protein HYH03_010379 [Edaphochlamys debaryana]